MKLVFSVVSQVDQRNGHFGNFFHQVTRGNFAERNLQVSDPNVPLWEIPTEAPYSGYLLMGYYPQEPPVNTINTMGTLLGVHPIIVPWKLT